MPAPGELVFTAPRGAKKPPRHLADLTPVQRKEAVAALGEKPFRAKQLAQHYFTRLAHDPAQWTDIPAGSRTRLQEALLPDLMSVVRHISCDDDTTRKTLWRLFDGTLVESVLMRYPDRVTMCISSQAGCGMNCPFCATGQAGLERNLSTAEIVHQIVDGIRALRDGDIGGGGLAGQDGAAGPARLSNIVFMGMGEPLANYSRVVGAIRCLTDPEPDGLGLSQRGITVSTVGLVPAMHRFADEGFKCRLAVSLHAPDDELRDTLVPVNTRWKVREVLDAAWEYAARSSRRVSVEYALIRDINDQAWRGDLLGRLLKGKRAHVNLIPLNPTPGSRWTASRPADEKAFAEAIGAHGVPVTVRDTRGQEIDGACGQLAGAER
jgi:23S rRNA (adenine2503-C2)-methyltransferase